MDLGKNGMINNAVLVCCLFTFQFFACTSKNQVLKDALIKQGDSLFHRWEYKEAYDAYQSAYEIDPNDEKLNLHLGNTAYTLHRDDEALRFLSKSISTKESSEAYANRGELYLLMREEHEASIDLHRALELDSENTLALIHLSSIERNNSNLRDAENNLRKALKINAKKGNLSDYYQAWVCLAQIFADRNEIDSSMHFFQKAIALFPESEAAYIARGTILYKIGKIDDSFQDFKRAIELNPKCGVCYRSLGVMYADKKNFSKCCEMLDSAQSLGARNVDFLFSKYCNRIN